MEFNVHKKWNNFFEENEKILTEINNNIDYQNNVVLPKKEYIYKSFKYFSPSKCKLVILGQDPYPGSTKQNNKKIYYAEGLSFSVNKDIIKLPASLKNIFKELKNNYPDFTFKNGSLLNWVKKEKIMLLNTSLTVIEGKPNSHSKLWSNFTDKVIQKLDTESKCIFLLMGNNAKKKEKLIINKERILTCVHPSPLSATRGFFDSNIFINVNQKLKDYSIKEIKWDNL